ncbi:MAG: MFS transporter [Candidatus Acidiferrales bacterium]
MSSKTEVQSMVGTEASRVRYVVASVICLLALISYVDRTCISVSGPYLASDLGLSSVQMGFVYGAFILSYGLFAVPGGLWGDKIGGRKVITTLVVLFSVFTALTGVVHALWSLVLVRFLFGAAESSVGPNSSKVIAKWLPPNKWGLAQGLMWMSGRIGGAFAPGLVIAVAPLLGWWGSFWFFAAIGCVWAVWFWFWFRDSPEEKRGVTEEEIRIIRARESASSSGHGFVRLPWATLLRSRVIWTICGMYFCFSYGWHFYMTWFPTYMKAQGFSTKQMGLFGGLPFFFGAFGCVAGGLLTDYVVKRTGSVKNRRYIGAAGFFLMAICMFLVSRMENAMACALTISMASFFGDLTLSSCWAVCMDVGSEYAGTITGLMSTSGNIGGFLFPVVSGFLVQSTGSWKVPIMVSGTIFLIGSILWLRVDSSQSVLDPVPVKN